MKKKFRLWLNIATICLCVCAIAIGVYAVQSAKLSVTGSIGFTAHNIEATVKVTMYSHAIEQDGSPIKKTDTEAVKQSTTEVKDGLTINLGSFFFTDMDSTDGYAEDIVIELEFTNNSTSIGIMAYSETAESDICTATDVTTKVTSAYIEKRQEQQPKQQQ